MLSFRWLIERKVTASFGLALLVLIFMSANAYFSGRRYRASANSVEHTYQVIDNTEGVLSQVKDAETGQRGYLLTGETRYLQPYQSALQNITPRLQKLRQLTQDNPRQQQRLTQLDLLVQEKLAELATTINLRQSQGLEAALQIVRTARGQRVMDQIRQLTEAIGDEEKFLLQQRSNAAAHYARQTTAIVVLGSIWAIALLGVALVLINRDISRRQRAEEQVRSLNSELERRVEERTAQVRQQETRFRQLIDANVIGVIVGTFDGALIEANDAFLDLVRYSRVDLLEGRVRWDTMTPPTHVEQDTQALEQLRTSGRCTPYEKAYIRSDGSTVPVLVGSAVLEQDAESIIAFVLDLSEQKQMENVLRQQAADLEQANRLKDEFLAMVSHELRTPLNSMLGWSKLLLERSFDLNMTQRGLETIQRNAQIQKQIIEDILDVSRIIRGQLRMDATPQNLIPIIHAVIDAVHPAADAKQIQITSVLNPSVGPVLGDSDRLQQIVWNLLSNAIKFTPQGGQVEVHLERVDSLIELRVRDTGIGIAPDFLPYVFDRFRQADSSTTRQYGGVGLGLAIVRQLVELHGGSIHAESAGLGQGSSFTVCFPVMAAQPQLDTTLRPAWAVRDQTDLSEGVLRGVQVLVVDDEADARELVAVILSTYGAMVTVAASTAEALEVFDQVQPDVLVSDIGMPEENGYVLIRRLRAHEATQNRQTPAIALTAYARDEDRRQVLGAGFQEHLAKPVDPTTLVTAIQQLLQGA